MAGTPPLPQCSPRATPTEIEVFFSVLLTGGSPRPIIGLALAPVFDTPDDFAAKLKKELEDGRR